MSENFINIELSDSEIDDAQVVDQSLILNTANIIGTSYKGAAFVPQKLYFSDELNNEKVYNTRQNILGKSRQNQIGHLYDEYSCFSDSMAYDAADFWLSNGGVHASFTRVLGIGINKKNSETGKMIGSGFNVSDKISSGTLSHTRSENINSISGGPDGNTTFILKTINEKSKRLSSVSDENVDINTVDYLSEIGYYESDGNHLYNITSNTNFISDVIFFPNGVIPNLTSTPEDNPFNYSTLASSYDSQEKSEITTSNCLIKLNGFKPYEIADETKKPFSFIKISSNNVSNGLSKQTQYYSFDKNYFPSRFLEKGNLTYASFPFAGINIDLNKNHKFNILCTKKYSDVLTGLTEADQNIPDYNSFESEYTTSKTPWITSQSINISSIINNRHNIHNSVVDLFRFCSLDDGEVGNRFRIKININKRGSKNIFKDSNINYADFDVYIFEYEPRNNSYNKLEVFKNLNLNPHDKNYIGRKIGTEHKYYDFEANRIVQVGNYKNKSQFLRVEMHKSIERESYSNQHEIIPSGFRSYPYIKLQKNSFKNWKNNDGQLNTLFDTQKVFQMPPMHALNYYEDYVLNQNENIHNNWGVVFTQPHVVSNVFKPKFDLSSLSKEKKQEESISPHFYYSKYFLSNCNNSSKDVWHQEDNYLNSFFHLEKIITKVDSSYDNKNPRNMIYKHSGRSLPSNSGYIYLDLSSDELWQDDRNLKTKYMNKLSFDFFTYGGFDGVDVRDRDKKHLKNDSIIREFLDQNEVKTTYTSYEKAIDIAMDDSNCASDVVVVPGIKELPLIRKVIQKCEEDRRNFFIADIAGAASNNKITYTNQNSKDLITSYGIMGRHLLIENDVSNYVLDSYNLSSLDKRFKISDDKFYSYKDLLSKQFDYTISNWNNENISSRYFMPVFGDLEIASVDELPEIRKQVAPETFVLSKIALIQNPRDSITSNEILPQSNQIENLITYAVINTQQNFENHIDFNKNTNILKKSGVNLVYKPITNNNVNIISENTAFENRRSLFQKQSIVRTIQDIKKRIKYNIFIDDSLIEGGFLFTQNANFQNVYTKLEIQLNTLLQDFVSAGLIENFKLRIHKREDDKTILDMQNYVIRGNIVLQFGQSDIIDLKLDELLSDLSLLTGEAQDTVEVPKI